MPAIMRLALRATAFFAALCAAVQVNAQPAKITYPATSTVEQADTYFGKTIQDPYRWLEKDDSPEVGKWVEAQNDVTFNYLKQIPFRDKIRQRIEKIWNFPKYTQPFRVGKKFFFHKNDGLQNQSVLYVQEGLEGKPSVFLDPNKLSADGTVAIGSIVPSHNDKYIAYDISRSGSDWKEIFVMDVNGKQLPDHLKWVKFSGMAWYSDGFFYSRYDEPKEGVYTKKSEYHKVYYHKLGTDQSQDALIYNDTSNATRLHFVGTTQDERWLTLYISQGTEKGNLLFIRDLRNPNSKFIPVHSKFGSQFYIIESVNDKLYAFTNLDAPRGRIVEIDPNLLSMDWKTVIPQQKDVLEGATLVGGKLFLTYMMDAKHVVNVHNLDGSRYDEVTLPALGSVSGFEGKVDDDFTFFSFTSFTYPATIYRYDVKSKKSKIFRKTEIDIKMDDYETKQVFVASKDGTKVPMFIVHKKGLKLDGTAPTYLYAYGGFNNSLTPWFSTSRMIILENGGVFALANLRGGGEYGEEWHEAGMGLKKQNVFDDFIACGEYLINQKYTSSNRLALAGASNGGLLVGAVINQRPDLAKVAFPAVGVMDMLRYHKFTIGWSWSKEYGTSDDSVHFNNLIKYSPLHTIKQGVNYPATMVTTADHDDRVVPAHSFKYIAALQAAQSKVPNANPTLIRIDVKAGHGAGKPTSKIMDEIADTYSFMFYNMGVTPKY
jgi:prolyl oligopeptidase